jgi:glutathione synthase/RimK-type ligase-like ATP-grasp enzyme
MKTLGFATYSGAPELTADDRLALPALRKRGIEVVPVVWRGGARPQGLEGLVLRSCWDYHQVEPEVFLDWVSQQEQAGSRVWNPFEVVRWNLHKRYLLEAGAHGARIPRTVCVERGAPRSLRDVLEESGIGPGLVIKPAVSLDGHDTFLFGMRHAEAERVYESLLRRGDVLVQEFIEDIQTEGELSLVFLGGTFSHAIRKRPARGGFRVQVEHGGTREPFQPTPAQVRHAEHLLALAGQPLLYARVDVVPVRGELVLMELELIDPMLFLGYAPGAPERFAEAVARACDLPGYSARRL